MQKTMKTKRRKSFIVCVSFPLIPSDRIVFVWADAMAFPLSPVLSGAWSSQAVVLKALEKQEQTKHNSNNGKKYHQGINQ